MKILKDGKYFGQVQGELRTNSFILSEYSYNIPKTNWHYHEDPYLMYLLEGQVYDINKKREKRCIPGSLLFHNWQEQHFNSKHSKHAKGFHIEIKQGLKKLLGKSIEIEGSIMVENPYSHIVLGKLYQEFSIQDSYSNIGIEALIINLIDSIEKEVVIETKIPKWLQELKDMIYEENDLNSLKELSHNLNIHPVHISRTFPKYYGCTLSEYIRMIKIKKSIPYILDNKHSLTEIAYQCGFTDQSHFSRTFKYYFGKPPSKFTAIDSLRC